MLSVLSHRYGMAVSNPPGQAGPPARGSTSLPARHHPMARERNPLRMPGVGPEVLPLAALARLPLPGARTGGGRWLAGSTLGGMAVFVAYQVLLTGLRSEALVRRGLIDRPRQLLLIAGAVAVAAREGLAVSLPLGLLLLLLPWLAAPLGLLGIVGFGKASLDLFHAVWDGLDSNQRGRLHQAAHAAGVNLGRLLR